MGLSVALVSLEVSLEAVSLIFSVSSGLSSLPLGDLSSSSSPSSSSKSSSKSLSESSYVVSESTSGDSEAIDRRSRGVSVVFAKSSANDHEEGVHIARVIED